MNPYQVNINLWQVTFTNPKWKSCHDHFWQNLLSNSPARYLVVTLMITSDNFLRNNSFPTESPRSSFCHVNDYLWHIISYGIHFLTPRWVFGRLPSKSIISLYKSPMDFPGCHVNNIPLTISSKWFPKEMPIPPAEPLFLLSCPACHLWTVEILSLVVLNRLCSYYL